MTDKKDVLDFPLEKLQVPHAIVLMMQAATKTVHHGMKHVDPLVVDNDRLAALTEKLEARIQDELDKGAAMVPAAADVEEPVKYESTSEDEVFKVVVEDEIKMVTVNGLVFGKLCNEPVKAYTRVDEVLLPEEYVSRCIKEWGHQAEHVDYEGGYK